MRDIFSDVETVVSYNYGLHFLLPRRQTTFQRYKSSDSNSLSEMRNLRAGFRHRSVIQDAKE